MNQSKRFARLIRNRNIVTSSIPHPCVVCSRRFLVVNIVSSTLFRFVWYCMIVFIFVLSKVLAWLKSGQSGSSADTELVFGQVSIVTNFFDFLIFFWFHTVQEQMWIYQRYVCVIAFHRKNISVYKHSINVNVDKQ